MTRRFAYLAQALLTLSPLSCASSRTTAVLPIVLQCRSGAPEPRVVTFPPSRPAELAATGQMTDAAATAKRTFDAERWVEAIDLLRMVESGATGDDQGNRQLAQYHRGIAHERLGEHQQALEVFLMIGADRNHLKWHETLLWLTRLLKIPDTAEAALQGIAAYDDNEAARFDNPQQRDLYWLIQMALGRIAYRNGDYEAAIRAFQKVGARSDVAPFARECEQRANAMRAP